MATVAAGLPAIQRDLLRFALVLTRHRERAADLVQDANERALAKAHLFDGSNLKAWCFTLMRNSHINGLRHLRVERSFAEDFIQRAPTCAGGGQEAAVLLREVLAIGRRRPTIDAPLLAMDATGATLAELCAHYRKPLGTMKSRVHRSRKALREAVQWEAA